MADTSLVTNNRVVYGDGHQIVKSIDGFELTIFKDYFIRNLGRPNVLKDGDRFNLKWSIDMLGMDQRYGPSIIKGILSGAGERGEFNAGYLYCFPNRCPNSEPHFIAQAYLIISTGKLCIPYADVRNKLISTYHYETISTNVLSEVFIVSRGDGFVTEAAVSRSYTGNGCLAGLVFSIYHDWDLAIRRVDK